MKLSIVLAAQLLYRNFLQTSRKVYNSISGMLIRVGVGNLFEKISGGGTLTTDQNDEISITNVFLNQQYSFTRVKLGGTGS